MSKVLIQSGLVVNEGKIEKLDILISDGKIEKIAPSISKELADEVIHAEGKYVLPGLIDDQVHFREPGLTHKANIRTESRAAVAGGITSFMEMPNTVPNALTQQLLQDKYDIASESSIANYSFFMGASNDNLDEVLKTDPKKVCGIKVFMGSSTGNMLVDQRKTLEGIFKEAPTIVATHCEDEATVRANMDKARAQYGEDVPMNQHPIIRSVEACYKSSSMAAELATKFGTRLHILHISTAKEVGLFRNDIPLNEKKITAEACTHHLWFTDADYDKFGSRIKWNPAVKSAADKEGIWKGLLEDRIDVLATDHAPHTLEEKANSYFNAPSGGPLVQHALPALLESHEQGRISIEKIVEKACHNPAILFEIDKRGFVREGYHADLVVVSKEDWTVSTENILYKCGWSPFEGQKFQYKIDTTLVNGNVVYQNDEIIEVGPGSRLTFNR
ncbi:MAG: dihydroorotase [Crocinitomicaceae bacterium]|nr:dihydroorotase [Crocinitomicaceae bacterium]